MKIVAVIPARYASTRFPGKPLIHIGGKTMIERVYEQAKRAQSLSDVIVATDDQRIFEAVRAFGGNVVMTGDQHRSGTDRLAEVATKQSDIGIIVNVQGDEPLIDPGAIDTAVEPMLQDSSIEMCTLAARTDDKAEINSPDVVKVVCDQNGFAMYFSRSPIPFYRDAPADDQRYYAHIGLYVYRRQTLLKLASLAPTRLEMAESLEQLRAVENGIRIRVVPTKYRPIAVDKPGDVANVERALASAALS